ncbi:MAG TPA: hypothetical protein VGS19_13140 [Streptosporangiaceae bacterium]|nr:hypothetical protein [Streptosporangiaceae bacterium]
MDVARIRALLARAAGAGAPPPRAEVRLARRRGRGRLLWRRAMECTAAVAAVAATAVAIPAGASTVGRGSGAAARHRPPTPTIYAAYINSNNAASVFPISTVTHKVGKPMRVGSGPFALAVTPDGKTAYVSCGKAVVPIRTATNTLARPIHIPLTYAQTIAINP